MLTYPSCISEGPWNQHDAEGAGLSAEKVLAAAKDGLAAAAMKSKLFADHEEREIQRLSANIINHQVLSMSSMLERNLLANVVFHIDGKPL